jgi:hypothetical protein
MIAPAKLSTVLVRRDRVMAGPISPSNDMVFSTHYLLVFLPRTTPPTRSQRGIAPCTGMEEIHSNEARPSTSSGRPAPIYLVVQKLARRPVLRPEKVTKPVAV